MATKLTVECDFMKRMRLVDIISCAVGLPMGMTDLLEAVKEKLDLSEEEHAQVKMVPDKNIPGLMYPIPPTPMWGSKTIELTARQANALLSYFPLAPRVNMADRPWIKELKKSLEEFLRQSEKESEE